MPVVAVEPEPAPIDQTATSADRRGLMVDPGAVRLADSLVAALELPRESGRSVTITLEPIRNQSRCAAEEFGRMLERLAGLLDDAIDTPSVNVVAGTDSAADFQLQGAAYLVTRGGFDVWELYLSATASQHMRTLWQPRGAVMMIRQPRPGQPQILAIPPN